MSLNAVPACQVVALGSPEFVRSIQPLAGKYRQVRLLAGNWNDAWEIIVGHHPDVILFDVGRTHDERVHKRVRQFLEQLRERFEKTPYVIAALTAPSRLAFGGDLLFRSMDSLEGSQFIDTFVASAPLGHPCCTSMVDQIAHALAMVPLARAVNPSLPALNSAGWIQSLAEPASRELWTRWLPRYAGYTNENPLIVGPTGTGKTNLAQALHRFSGRTGKFVGITPRDFSSSELVQAELFGAVPGAYTGAVERWGLVKSAERGTLFLDELQSIDKDLQGKLITFIENKIYRRVGSSESISADVRFVFATNRPLQELLEHEVLRDDFAFRLERVQLELLALYKRPLDIPAALAYSFAKVARIRSSSIPIHGCDDEAFRLLFSHRWPGNLRQLENSVAKLCEDADIFDTPVVNKAMVRRLVASRLYSVGAEEEPILSEVAHDIATLALEQDSLSLSEALSSFEHIARRKALNRAGGSVEKAAELLRDDPRLLTMQASAMLVPEKS